MMNGPLDAVVPLTSGDASLGRRGFADRDRMQQACHAHSRQAGLTPTKFPAGNRSSIDTRSADSLKAETTDARRIMAWQGLCRALLSSNEFIYLELTIRRVRGSRHDELLLRHTGLERPLSRRLFLEQIGAGFGGLALFGMLAEEATAGGGRQPARPEAAAFQRRRSSGSSCSSCSAGLRTSIPSTPSRCWQETAASRSPPENRPRVLSFPNGWGTWSAHRFSSASTATAGSGLARSSRSWRAAPTTSASSTRCTAPTRDTAVPCWNGTRAPTRSSGRAWVPGSRMGWEREPEFPRLHDDLPGPVSRAVPTTSARVSCPRRTRGRRWATPA